MKPATKNVLFSIGRRYRPVVNPRPIIGSGIRVRKDQRIIEALLARKQS